MGTAQIETIDDAVGPAEYERWRSGSLLEGDRICLRCGYNLRMQPIRREPRTALFVVRCPECATFHYAGAASSWIHGLLERGRIVILALWIVFMLSLFVTCGVIDGISTFELVEEWVLRIDRNMVRRPPRIDETVALVSLGVCSALATGLIAGALLLHWRPRWRDVLVVLTAAVPAAIIVGIILLFLSDHAGRQMALNVTGVNLLIQLAAGFTGALVARPLARGLVRMFVPPRWRGPMAILWLVDGKQPPFAAMPGAAR
jgi:hypothetical protein